MEEQVKYHSKCIRCGRKLTNPDYQIIGYGPVCYNKILSAHRPIRKSLFNWSDNIGTTVKSL